MTEAVGWRKEGSPYMLDELKRTSGYSMVDDNRDGADALGLLIEELGNQVHVTYGGPRRWKLPRHFGLT